MTNSPKMDTFVEFGLLVISPLMYINKVESQLIHLWKQPNEKTLTLVEAIIFFFLYFSYIIYTLHIVHIIYVIIYIYVYIYMLQYIYVIHIVYINHIDFYFNVAGFNVIMFYYL